MIPATNQGPPMQTRARGWQNQFGGLPGIGIVRQPFAMADGPDIQGYFNGQRKPTSSVQFGGQPHVGNYVDPCEY